MLTQILISLLILQTAQASSCLSSSCHENLVSKKNVHGPMRSDGCKVCHIKEPGTFKVNIGSKKTSHQRYKKESVKELNKTCLICHDEYKEKIEHSRSIHKPISEKSCVSCHDPHQSQHDKLLIQEKSYALCIKCHETKSDKNSFTYHKLKEMKNGCLSCHESHISKNDKLLTKSSVKELCLGCHGQDKKVEQWKNLDKKHLHEPVLKEECTKCHQVHGSHNKGLLEKTFNQKANFSKDHESAAVALCLKCHNQEFSSNSKFRNGSTNLHALHLGQAKVKKDCFACHTIHGSVQGALIRSEFEYLNKQLPLKYLQIENGGNCTTACHKKMTYDRVKEVVNEKEK